MPQRLRQILVLSPQLPRPDQNSGDRRLAAILGLLAVDNNVDLCVDQPVGAEDARYVKQLHRADVRLLRPGLWHAIASGLLPSYDVIFYEFHYSHKRYGKIIRLFLPHAVSIIDSVDVHFLREAAATVVSDADAPDVESEMAAYRAVNTVIAITREDAAAIAQRGGVARLYTLPNIVERRPRPAMDRARRVLFVGGFRHEPNVDGICWFVEQVWPLVRERVSDATLTVVGSHPPPRVIALSDAPGVTVRGFVPETNPYLDVAAVSVAPLRYGAGMKGKVNEAMASGVPVVTTRFGAQGLDATPGEHLLIADDPTGFAAAVVLLLQDPAHAEQIGRAGQALNDGVCGRDSARSVLRWIVEEVAPMHAVVSRRTIGAWLRSRPLGPVLALRQVRWIRAGLRRWKLHW